MLRIVKWLGATAVLCITAYEYKGQNLEPDEVDTLTIVSTIIRKLV